MTPDFADRPHPLADRLRTVAFFVLCGPCGPSAPPCGPPADRRGPSSGPQARTVRTGAYKHRPRSAATRPVRAPSRGLSHG